MNRPAPPGDAAGPPPAVSQAALARLAARAGPMDPARDGPDWPGFADSRRVTAAGLAWQVVRRPAAPAHPGDPAPPRLLFIHGTGASTHSWRGLWTRLEGRAELLAVDLPGHGFSEAPQDPRRHRLDGMAEGLATLLARLGGEPPAWIVGHSAGAALAVELVQSGALAPRGVIAFNAALRPYGGALGGLLLPLARRLATLPGVPDWLARRVADPTTLRRMLADTGSVLDREGEVLYGRLARSPEHVGAALAMMAHWDLAPLERRLPGFDRPLHLVASAGDRTVSPDVSWEVAQRCPAAVLHPWPRLGHLAHEEAPGQAADLVAALAGLNRGGDAFSPADVKLD